MANADQILSLIRCHVEGDDERFRSLALQVSATEAKAGHVVLARSIKEIIKTVRLRYYALLLIYPILMLENICFKWILLIGLQTW